MIEKMVDARILTDANAHESVCTVSLLDKDPLTQDQSLADAEKAVQESLKLGSDNADTLALASSCQQRKRDFVAAREYLRKSVAVNPNVPQRYLDLAVLERQASPDDPKAGLDAAIAVLRQGVRAIPEPLENFELRWKLVDLLISKTEE